MSPTGPIYGLLYINFRLNNKLPSDFRYQKFSHSEITVISDKNEPGVFDERVGSTYNDSRVGFQCIDHFMAGIEDITGHHGHHRFRDRSVNKILFPLSDAPDSHLISFHLVPVQFQVTNS